MDQNFFLQLNKDITSSFNTYSLGLANGQMGLCVYFYHLSSIYENSEYEEIAEKILDNIINNIPPYESIDTLSISAGNGLASIAIGLDHLLKCNFIEGDINEILKDIDEVIFKKIAFEENKFSELNIEELIYLLYYLYIRYVEQKQEEDLFLFSELIIMTIESIDKKINPSFFNNPLSFSLGYPLAIFLFLLSKVMSLNIYNYRITKILDRYKTQFSSVFPTSHANRLLLLLGILSVNTYYKKIELTEFANLLKNNIDINYILNRELKNTQLYLFNGVSLVFALAAYIDRYFPESAFDFDIRKFQTRILYSEIWSAQKNEPYSLGMVGGISGILLTLSYMNKYYKV